MSDPYPTTASAARPRPGTVTIAGYLLYAVAAVQLIQLIISLTQSSTFGDVYDEALAGTEAADAAGAFSTGFLIGGAVISLLVAVGLVVLALLNNRGKNAARIVTWVLGGIFFCCSAAGLGLGAAGNALTPSSSSDPNVPDQAEIQRMLDDRLPGWYDPVTTLLSVVTVVAVLVALILLALPPSNEFFRKAQPVWEPPAPGSAYPGYPQAGYAQSTPPSGATPQTYGLPPTTPAAPYGPPPTEQAPPRDPAGPPGGSSDDQPGPPAPRSEPPTS
ncbi:hypothetical protein ACI2K4_20360 [Micromonospora sp. NPDC050397]|uniref:hypothetical protein n=1 Tax=Micromonospora sp. NPDC050397 TaxID=3364279 RepID=UPI003850AC0B